MDSARTHSSLITGPPSAGVFGTTGGGIAGISPQAARRAGGLTHDEQFFLLLNGDTAEDVSGPWAKLAHDAGVTPAS